MLQIARRFRLPEFAPQYGGGELSGPPIVKAGEFLDRDQFHAPDSHSLALDEPLESSDRHLVQPSCHLVEGVRAVAPDVRSPLD